METFLIRALQLIMSPFERCCVNADTDGVFLLKSKK